MSIYRTDVNLLVITVSSTKSKKVKTEGNKFYFGSSPCLSLYDLKTVYTTLISLSFITTNYDRQTGVVIYVSS